MNENNSLWIPKLCFRALVIISPSSDHFADNILPKKAH